MSDGVVVLPRGIRAALQPPSPGPAAGSGIVGLRQRPTDSPIFDTDEISIDVPGLRLGIGEDGEISTSEDDAGGDNSFSANLAIDYLDDIALSGIAEEVLTGVEADEQSRREWYTQYEKGIDLLGLKVEDVKQGQTGQRDPSRAGDTTLIEAMVKYEAAAEAELLPAAGPAKVTTIGQASPEEEARAKAFQDDFNYYLTEVATEYYPDTPRMLMQQAFCGIGYKKVYFCPIRHRPVSESVLPTDLIVSAEATDLVNALRVTHRIEMTEPVLRRMQLIGQYRDVDIGPAGALGMDPGDIARRKVRESQGILAVPAMGRPQDIPHEILETDVYLDPSLHNLDGAPERKLRRTMPLPYKVTIDRTSRKVLGLWRNWKDGDPLYLKQNMFVKFGLVPGLDYHDWGFLQLLGNQTRAIRAILRLLIAAGMFSNFPGGIKARGVRMATNELAPAPGEWVEADLPQNANIQQQFMALPYKEPSAVLVQLMEIVKQDAMRLGGTVQLEVGEGRTNVPVGTILAMIEQQVQVMAGVHKRNHRAQKEEFRKLRDLFAEDPESFALMVRDRPRQIDVPYWIWQKAEEFSDLNLVPASDPNVPSHVHKLLMGNVLLLLAQQAPNFFDMRAVLANAVSAIGADPEEFLVRPDQAQAPPPPDPKVVAATIKQQTDQAKQQTEAATSAARLQVEREKLAVEAAKSAAENQTALTIAHTRAASDAASPYHEAAAAPPAPPALGGIG